MSGYKTKLIVAAIDFGTTYSGYAYSFRDEYQKDPLKIYANTDWSDGSGLVTLKAPTVVLFNKAGQFDSFGYEQQKLKCEISIRNGHIQNTAYSHNTKYKGDESMAENRYAHLSESDAHVGWKYFRRFKMELHNKTNLRRVMMLSDDQGNKMPAIEVFAAAIKYLKNHLMQRLTDRIKEIKETDIHWVLTVPAIWQDSAKQFMQEAAGKAGIPIDQLELALEPEAAAIYCKELAVAKAKEQGKQAQLKTFDPGAQFMVLDLGGGTMDITAHEVQRDGNLKELSKPSGGPWGGTLVDKYIFERLESLFEKRIISLFKNECKPEDLDLQRMIEIKKRTCKPTESSEGKIMLSIPSALYDIFKDEKGETFEMSLSKSIHAMTIKKRREKLQFEPAIFQSCFKESKDNLLNHVKNLLRQPQLRNVKTIMMVGGFSESPILRTAVKEAFEKQVTVIVPDQAEIAVVKGAVMYGHNTSSISSRILPHSYGISTAIPFDERKHPNSKKVYRDGHYKCEDVFKVFIRAGTTVVPRQTKAEYTFTAPFVGSSRACIEIYRSELETPMFVSDSDCSRIGEIVITLMKQPPDEKQMIDVIMWFGDTMLHVEARESGTKNKANAEFNCLR